MDAEFATSINVDSQTLKTLKGKSDVRGWVQAGTHLGALIVNTIALVYFWSSFLAIPLFMAQGILINCLYAGVHELSHNSVFKTRWLNEFFGRTFCCTPSAPVGQFKVIV